MENLNSAVISPEFVYTRKDQLLLNYFLLGFILYTVFYALTNTGKFSYVIGQGFQLIGLGLMLPSLFLLLRIKFESDYLKLVFGVYFFWLAGVVARGFTTDYSQIKSLMFDAWFGAMLYIVPLFVLLPRKLYYYRRFFDLIFLFSLLNVALDVLFLNDVIGSFDADSEIVGKSIVEIFSKSLGIPAGFILLTYPYHSRKRVLAALIAMSMAILFGIIRARRGLIFMASFPILISYMLYLYNSQIRMKGLMMTLTVIAGLFMNTYALDVFNKGNLFKQLNERALEDTRSGVEVRFYRDFQWNDWLFGRGMLGKYYCPEVPDPDDNSGYRKVIETDFLQIVLKGGLVSFLLLMAVLIPAMLKGVFRSNNLLSKAAGIWIFIALVNMYPSSVNTFTLNYILVWLCVGICYSRTIRNIPDDVLTQCFQ